MSSPASIVVTYASVGSGHRVAAEAVARELTALGEGAVTVTIVDALEGRSTWPADVSDGRLGAWSGSRWLPRLLTPLSPSICAPLTSILTSVDPAVVVSTHPLATMVAARLESRGRIHSRVVTVPTDFDVAGVPPRHGVTLHCVASDDCAAALSRHGVPARAITVTGIPVRSQFTVEYDATAARQHFGLPADKRIILAIAGSSEPESYTALKESLAVSLPALASLPDITVAVVAGHDRAFATEMTSRSKGFGTRNVRILDHVEHMAPLMACADLIIARPAGLLCAECVSSGVPVVLVGPSVGHERANARTLVTAGAAVLAEDPSTLADHARKTLASQKRLARMREATSTLARPFAAEDIARRALALAGVHSDPGDETSP